MSVTRVVIKSIPHQEQRYDTCGDWQVADTSSGDQKLVIHVSSMDPRYEMLIAVHELIESIVYLVEGGSEAAVDAFDMEYEKNRTPADKGEPGDDPRAPYHTAHVFATKIERQLAERLGIDWSAYESTINELPPWGKDQDDSNNDESDTLPENMQEVKENPPNGNETTS